MATAGAGNHRRTRFVLLPLFAQGHQIAMTDLALALARRGELVTLVTTPVNATRLRPTLLHSARPVDLLVLPLPTEKTGLPPGCESADLLPFGLDSTRKIFLAISELEQPLKDYLQSLDPHRPCLVVDFTLTWTQNLARDLNIRRYVFYSVGCFSLYCLRALPHHFEREGIELGDPTPVVIPGIPHHVEITRDQGHGWMPVPEAAARERRRVIETSDDAADGVVVNTFLEAEAAYVEIYGGIVSNKVWPVGPLCLHNSAPELRGASVEAAGIVSWLDGREAGSVVYVCLGSLTRVATEQQVEIGMGLEASGRAFLWAVDGKEKREELEEWLAGGFEERTRGRGMVVRGWAPQVLVLSHAAVGAFVTHCGWNSVVEGLAAGLPMVTWPWFGDQFMNERMVVDVAGTGVAVGARDVKWWWEYHGGTVVGRGVLAAAVRKVMGGGGDEVRRRARELAEKARRAVRAGGSSEANLAAFVEEATRGRS